MFLMSVKCLPRLRCEHLIVSFYSRSRSSASDQSVNSSCAKFIVLITSLDIISWWIAERIFGFTEWAVGCVMNELSRNWRSQLVCQPLNILKMFINKDRWRRAAEERETLCWGLKWGASLTSWRKLNRGRRRLVMEKLRWMRTSRLLFPQISCTQLQLHYSYCCCPFLLEPYTERKGLSQFCHDLKMLVFRTYLKCYPKCFVNLN